MWLLKNNGLSSGRNHSKHSEAGPGFRNKSSTEPLATRYFVGDIFVPTLCSQRNWEDALPQPQRLKSDLDKLGHPNPEMRESGTAEINQHVSNLRERQQVIEAVIPLLSDSRTVEGASRCLRILRATDAIPLIEGALAGMPESRTREAVESNLRRLSAFPNQPTQPEEFFRVIDVEKAIADTEQSLGDQPGELGKARVSAYLEPPANPEETKNRKRKGARQPLACLSRSRSSLSSRSGARR